MPEYSENMQHAQAISKASSDIIGLVTFFERGSFPGPLGTSFELSVAQINQLKALFTGVKNECISHLNAISG